MTQHLTTLTLTVNMGRYHIATMPNGEQCFIHAAEVEKYPDCNVFSAIVVENEKDHPKWYAKRISDETEIVAPVGIVEGYDQQFDMAYAAGLCSKAVILSQGQPSRVWYMPNPDGYYIEEFE